MLMVWCCPSSAQAGKPGSGSITMDALWRAIEMEKAKARDPRLSKIERAETLRVRYDSLCFRSKPHAQAATESRDPLTAMLNVLHLSAQAIDECMLSIARCCCMLTLLMSEMGARLHNIKLALR